MEMDRTVLLVDADAHRSDVSVLLGLGERPGLTEHLLGEEPDLSRLLVRTNVDKLTVLPSGRRIEHVSELYASNEMSLLVAELAGRYHDRVVIFDSPPLLATSESGVLADLAGQVLLIVEAVRTPQRAIKEAIARLDGCEHVGIVLNKSREVGSSKAYDYGYGY